jgi:predicted TIM-barrel fold metal-dependent hydrolase
VIVDAHTHVFPPFVLDRRDALLETEPTFRELYSDARARLATAEELLASMDAAGIDASVIVGFAWQDPALCAQHNDYLLDVARRSGGRLIPFVTVNPSDAGARDELRRCAAAGARGIGELRPANQGFDLGNSDEADLLLWASSAYDLPLLFHVSEPVGHPYAGKRGLPIEQFYRFVSGAPGVTVIGAHWGGGAPLYGLMPEVRGAFETVYFDTAASPYLYDPAIFRHVAEIVGPDRILFASDFPLVAQQRALDDARAGGLDDRALALVLGENARRLLGLSDVRR